MAEIADLQQKLLEHKNQLAEVVKLLALSPDDPELLQIKADLEQVVALTEELAGGVDVSALADRGTQWKVGDRCTAKWDKDGKYYAATINQIVEDDYHIMFLDYGNQVTVPETAIKPYSCLSKDQLTQGALIRAIWGEDGLFYDAIVSHEAEEGGKFTVRFPQFGKKKFLVSIYDTRPRIGKNAPNPDAALPDEWNIPEHLKMKSGDTDAQRRNKRQRVKMLKQQFKKRKVEQEGSRKTANWQGFLKSAKTTSIFPKKSSMFATSEEGTVGVIGSGRGMTENPSLAKHRFVEPEEDDPDAGDEA